MLKLALCAMSAALCVATAHADPNAYGHTLPPKRFSGQPTVPVIDNVISIADVTTICINMGLKPPPGRSLWGCAHTVYIGSTRTCLIYRINDDIVRRHELGHCAGWPDDHPNEVELEALDIKIAALVTITPPMTTSSETVATFEQRWPSYDHSHVIWRTNEEHAQ